MTVSYVASYRTPDDPAEFERNCFGSHVPTVERTPGPLENRVHRVTRRFVGGPATTCSPSWSSSRPRR
jgi:hypothetical protein